MAAFTSVGGARSFANGHITYPRLEGTVLVEIQNDYLYKSKARTTELNDLYNTSEIWMAFRLNPYVNIQTSLTFEPVRAPIDDRNFDDQGIYAEELFVELRPAKKIQVFAGKFNPAFGIAWDKGPGLYGVDFAEDYEIAERLGVGFELTIKILHSEP